MQLKTSKSLKTLVKIFKWQDSFKYVHPNSSAFSIYYSNDQFWDGATRIDRQYHWGKLEIIEAKLVGLAFSDHMAQIFKIKLPENFSRLCSPKFKPQFKSKPEVIKDPEFNTRLQSRVAEWRYGSTW